MDSGQVRSSVRRSKSGNMSPFTVYATLLAIIVPSISSDAVQPKDDVLVEELSNHELGTGTDEHPESSFADSGSTKDYCEDQSCQEKKGPNLTERTFIMVKPDGVQRGLVGEIIKRFEQRGFHLVAMKFMKPTESLLEEHYEDLKSLAFFPGLIKHMLSGPVVAMVWEGLGVVKTGRVMLGETDPAKSKPGTIRGDFCIQIGRNIIHGSDSVETAKKEIGLWFNQKELLEWKSKQHSDIYE